MAQMNLKNTAVQNIKGKVTEKQESSYNRFFLCAFTEIELEEIIESGGTQSVENFKILSEQKMSKKDYWEKMFNPTFEGRDKVIRKSKFTPLGNAIYSNYLKGLMPVPRVIKYKRGEKEITRTQVPKGKTFVWSGKTYRAGVFLPKDFGIN